MMKPRSRWPLLLALLLGVGTWLGIGWWLSPRAYWEGWYEPIQGKRIGSRACIIDRDDRYLYVETHEGLSHRYDLIDLHTRKRVVSNVISNTVFCDRIQRGGPLSDSQAVVLPVVDYHYARTGGITTNEKYDGCDLWLWNLLTNESQLIQRYPETTNIIISQDGSTMLEVERITPSLPTPFPNDFATLLGSLAPKALHCVDLQVIRVWSIPQMTLRCTMTTAGTYRHKNVMLSFDGSCLGFLDTILEDGWVSNEIVQQVNGDTQSLALPQGIKVFDAHTGALRAEHSGYDGGYVTCDTLYPGLLLYAQIDTQAINKHCMLNLRNNQWIQDSDAQWPVLDIHQYSLPQLNTFCLGKGYASLLPTSVNQWFNPQGSFSQWLHQPRWGEVKLYNHRDQSNFLTMHTQLDSEFRAYLTKRWLVLAYYKGDTYHVSVQPYPLVAPPSPWWARGAGTVVMLLCWLAFRRSRVK